MSDKFLNDTKIFLCVRVYVCVCMWCEQFLEDCSTYQKNLLFGE